jgi:hypothetical protein
VHGPIGDPSEWSNAGLPALIRCRQNSGGAALLVVAHHGRQPRRRRRAVRKLSPHLLADETKRRISFEQRVPPERTGGGISLVFQPGLTPSLVKMEDDR